MTKTHLVLALFMACFLLFCLLYQWFMFGLETAEMFMLNVFILLFVAVMY